MKKFAEYLFESSKIVDSNLLSFNEILGWIDKINGETKVSINKITLEECTKWYYDKAEGSIHNADNSFFSVKGIEYFDGNNYVCHPIIVQPEIGYLGLICKVIDGILYFLMQAKIEPGNINVVQISPTIQATKSNFTKKHGGKTPAYLDYFENVKLENVIVDQIQSEQGSRFLRKRNRNIIIFVDDEIELFPNHKWMTLGQLHKLLNIPNLVNMDTRTVLSLLMHLFFSCENDVFLINCTVHNQSPDYKQIVSIYHCINNYKMYFERQYNLCDPFLLSGWKYHNGVLYSDNYSPFDVVFCDIEIEGREVRRWCQPLFRSKGPAIFALLYRKTPNGIEYLVSLKQEIGLFDIVELGPSLQIEYGSEGQLSEYEKKILDCVVRENCPLYDNFLSEEGGRFYHEENRNVIVFCKDTTLFDTPQGYFWCSLSTLSALCQINNVLNIQLRNLLSLVEL